MPIIYNILFRKALGARYDSIELPIWVEGGKEVKKIAQALGLPSENAVDISDTYTMKTIKRMCNGDPYCENAIELKE